MTKKKINTSHAPAAIGPYSQAIVANQLLFTSGQIALDPATGEIISGGVKEQAIQVFKNLQAILDEAKLTFDDTIKATVFLSDMNNFNIVNEIYATYFSADHLPARSVVEVARLPKDVMIEIELIVSAS